MNLSLTTDDLLQADRRAVKRALMSWGTGRNHTGEPVRPGRCAVVVLDNADGRFTPGQFGRVRIFFGAPKPTLLVPETAIGSDQSRKFVLVVNAAGDVEYRQVQLGPAVRGLRIVKAGLKPDERLVIHGLQLARPGQKVRPAPGQIADVQAASIAQAAAPLG